MPDGTANVEEQPAPASAPDAPRPRRRLVLSKKAIAALTPKTPREQSTIAFPYGDLEMAISVALAMLSAGGVALTREQLAGVTGLSLGSGNFILKTATARTFGLITYAQGKFELTSLGFEAVSSDEKERRTGRARAFLTVPLYQRVYEEFRGKQLPPRPHGLEQAFVRFGVATKQRTNARQAFDRSAKQAGFFDNGMDRLVEPIIVGGGNAPPQPPGGDGGARAPRRPQPVPHDHEPTEGLHPFIQGLLDTLPAPQSTWTVEGRAKWLQAAANIFDLIYTGDGVITIHAKAAPAME